MRSIHDNLIYAYSVLCSRRRIVLHTEFRQGGGASGPAAEHTDVVFDGVLAHHFEKAFEISSSYGLSGWVLAETMTLRERSGRAPGDGAEGCAT
jgi:hypothetical protein